MVLSTSDLAKIVGLCAPVLMLDTCVVLDIVRDITRKTVHVHNIKAAIEILKAAESGSNLVLLMAEQTSVELNDNLQNVEKESQVALEKFLEQAERIDEIAIEFGAQGAMVTAHLDDHVTRARAVLDRWVHASIQVKPGPDAGSKAMMRVVNAIAPSRRGKESAKDCLVVETYLETAAQLRAANFNGKIVFGSSNTDDYFDPNTKKLYAKLQQEFAVDAIEFGHNFGSMKHELGL